jgi:spermidine/putrescine transport system ATP-binding protein
MEEEEIILELDNVSKTFDNQEVVQGISLSIKKGEFLTLLGPSGCGKTTTLRMIAGFEKQDSGNIILEDQCVNEFEPNHRNVNTVFQNYALFPHMNVYDNIAYSLKIKKVNKNDISQRVKEMLSLVQLSGFEKRKPEQLSGGQRQRVAIARALINNPKVLLLDEPLGALDLKLRKQMQMELKKLQRKLGITFVYVTHDQEEAFNMSDRIVVMNNGIIEQIGRPRDIYEKPVTNFVANFIGESNFFDAVVCESDGNTASIEIDGVKMHLQGKNLHKGQKIKIAVRPENMKYSEKSESGYGINGTIIEYIYVGSMTKISIRLEDNREIIINSYDRKAVPLDTGAEVKLFWDMEDMVIILDGGEADETQI